MNLEKLEKTFELAAEILFIYNGSDPRKNSPEAIQRLNDELWNAGYMTWMTKKDGKACLSVRPRSAR